MPPRFRRLISPERFDAAMTERGISNQQLADEVGCTKGNIGHLRTGLVRRTTVDRATAIEALLAFGAPLFEPDPTSRTRRPTTRQGKPEWIRRQFT